MIGQRGEGETRPGSEGQRRVLMSGRLGGPWHVGDTWELSRKVVNSVQTGGWLWQGDGLVLVLSLVENSLWPSSIPEALAGCQHFLLSHCANKYLLAGQLNHLGKRLEIQFPRLDAGGQTLSAG